MERNPVGWFEVPVIDMERALKFYRNLLNIEFQKYDKSQMEMYFFPHEDVKGAGGALVKNEHCLPSDQGVLIYFTSSTSNLNLDGKVASENGGKVLVPTMSIGEHGYISVLLDSEGNKIALHTRELKEE